MERNYLTEWKRFLTEQTAMPKQITQTEKIAFVKQALDLYAAGKTAQLDPGLKTDLEAIKTKYSIESRPDFAANVFDVYVEKNPLFKFIDSNA